MFPPAVVSQLCRACTSRFTLHEWHTCLLVHSVLASFFSPSLDLVRICNSCLLVSGCSPVNVPQPGGTPDQEVLARLECVTQLTSLLPILQAQAHCHSRPSGVGGVGPQGGSSPSDQQFALTEDWQLRGFLPLQQRHNQLVFEKQDIQVCSLTHSLSDAYVLCVTRMDMQTEGHCRNPYSGSSHIQGSVAVACIQTAFC